MIAPSEYAAAVLPALRRCGLPVVLEPGRAIVGRSGALVSRIVDTKQNPDGRRFARDSMKARHSWSTRSSYSGCFPMNDAMNGHSGTIGSPVRCTTRVGAAMAERAARTSVSISTRAIAAIVPGLAVARW